ncbi:MAG: hypothetical protein AAGA99_26375 [Actinomycetota bacterium]
MARRVDGQLTEAVTRLGGRAAKRAGRRTRRRLDRTEPIDTSELARSRYDDEIETRDGPGVRIGYTAEHAVHVRNGTRPHEIRPKRATVLAFPGRGGRTVFAKKVQHPGTKPNRWFDDAIEAWPDEVRRAIRALR